MHQDTNKQSSDICSYCLSKQALKENINLNNPKITSQRGGCCATLTCFCFKVTSIDGFKLRWENKKGQKPKKWAHDFASSNHIHQLMCTKPWDALFGFYRNAIHRLEIKRINRVKNLITVPTDCNFGFILPSSKYRYVEILYIYRDWID